MTTYRSPADLAEMLVTTPEQILQWRREHSWPSIKIGRQIRFSPEHVEQILAMHEAKPAEAKPAPEITVAVEGQTARSARSRRAS